MRAAPRIVPRIVAKVVQGIVPRVATRVVQGTQDLGTWGVVMTVGRWIR